MELTFFVNKKGNKVCLCKNEKLIVAKGDLTDKEVVKAIESDKGHWFGKNYLIGFGEASVITVGQLKLAGAREEDLPEIDEEV